MSTSSILWMVIFLGTVWGGLAASMIFAVTRDRKKR